MCVGACVSEELFQQSITRTRHAHTRRHKSVCVCSRVSEMSVCAEAVCCAAVTAENKQTASFTHAFEVVNFRKIMHVEAERNSTNL